MLTSPWDAIIVGSGFGGVMAAHPLVSAGMRVLMIERGGWVPRGPESWGERGPGLVGPHYTMETPYDVVSGGRASRAGQWSCVGGQSVFYGGASFRFRESDFSSDAPVLGDSGAEWPFDYDDLEPYYALAERLLGISGEACVDPGEPRRSAPYPEPTAPLSEPSRRLAEAAMRLGLTPSRIPLAISYRARGERRACIRCGTCDGYACAAEAKNDLATGRIPALVRRGMVLRPNTVCLRLVRDGARGWCVECVDRVTGQRSAERAPRVLLAAGTLATPHLLLASGLEAVNPAGAAVGRYLTRHRNVSVLGVFPRRPNPERTFDKQIALFDDYESLGGSIQQMTPPLGLVRAYLPTLLRTPGARLVAHSLGLVVIAEDEPRFENGVAIDPARVDRFGMPVLRVMHRYTSRDERAAAVLVRRARNLLREAGARLTWTHRVDTFTHALGTVRMGVEPRRSPVDGDGRYRGVEGLYVVDGSVIPRSAGVNPSLTIAAIALRIGARLARSTPPIRQRVLRTYAPHQVLTITAP